MTIPAHPRCRCCIIPILDPLTLSKPYDNLNTSNLIGVPASETSGSNEDIREWYYVNIHNIPNLLDKSLPLEQQAKQAYELRNQFKQEARDAMNDREKAQKLDEKYKPYSFEELIKNKMFKYELTREQALEDIIRCSSINNKAVDDVLFGGIKK